MPGAPTVGFSMKQEFCAPNSPSSSEKVNISVFQCLFMKTLSISESCKSSQDALSPFVHTYPDNSNMNSVLRRLHIKSFHFSEHLKMPTMVFLKVSL